MNLPLFIAPSEAMHWLGVLLDVALKGAAILALAGAATLLLRRSSAAVRHRIWTLAVLAVLALPSALTLGLFSLLTLPLNNAFSRWREKRADLYALRVTRKPEAFASAMTRLANQNLAEANPERWVVWLLHSHPPIRDRVAVAQSFVPNSPAEN